MKIIIYLLFTFSILFAQEITLSTKQIEYLKNKKTITMCVDPVGSHLKR